MKKKLAIKGHTTRGKEVIVLLEMLGGKNVEGFIGTASDELYTIEDGCIIQAYDWNNCVCFTLKEFLEKYPFKVGDVVFDVADGDIGTIAVMKWDEDVSDMKYRVDFNNGDIGWYTYDTIEFLKGDKNLEERKTSVKNHKMGPKSKLPSKYYDEIQTKRDMDKATFMTTHMMLPKTPYNVNDELEYKIIDGYEFDRVENDKIILKVVKHKYPTTYEECCEIIGINRHDVEIDLPQPYQQKMFKLFKLLIYRDAYWKIAGEEMGLGKSWESPLPSLFETVYCIRRKNNEIIKGSYRGGKSEILEFPTEEMRDAFYENFKELIEACKELL